MIHFSLLEPHAYRSLSIIWCSHNYSVLCPSHLRFVVVPTLLCRGAFHWSINYRKLEAEHLFTYTHTHKCRHSWQSQLQTVYIQTDTQTHKTIPIIPDVKLMLGVVQGLSRPVCTSLWSPCSCICMCVCLGVWPMGVSIFFVHYYTENSQIGVMLRNFFWGGGV